MVYMFVEQFKNEDRALGGNSRAVVGAEFGASAAIPPLSAAKSP